MKNCTFLITLFLLSFINNSCDKNIRIKKVPENKDSTAIWIENSKNKSLPLYIRKQGLFNSYKLLKAKKIDQESLKNLRIIAYQYSKWNDTLLFKKINKEALQYAIQLKDSFFIGDFHWNYASFYNNKQVSDSAYYHFNTAEKYFKKHPYYKAKMLIGKAYIKKQFSDYIGSEIHIIQAIQFFKKLNNYLNISSCYNSLAIIQLELEEYDIALEYFKKAIENENKSKKKNKFSIYNNIGLTYQKKGSYTDAIFYFKKDYNTQLKKEKPQEYARFIDNIAYTKLLNKDTLGIKKELHKALSIRDSLQNKSDIISSYIHLSEYYLYKKDSLSAKLYTKKANDLAKIIKNNRDYLVTLKDLAKLDKKNAAFFLKKHITFKDSLQTAERKIQNKFTRISFETDQYIERTEELSEQKKWLSIIIFFTLLTTSLLYYLI